MRVTGMVTMKLDSVEFRLKEFHDFGWLRRYGKAFWCVDATGSGCIGIGMEDGERKYFCKIAGVNSVEAEVEPEEAVVYLKKAVPLYRELSHPSLVRVVEAYPYGEFYVVVFQWIEGECLFDHWNFDRYKRDKSLKSPKEKFRELAIHKRMRVVEELFSFLEHVNSKGYVAVDFYDGSIMYDFVTDKVTFCDIDLFRKAPVVNDMGADWYGTKRLKAPEEYVKGSAIDEQTNIFTLGALIFEFFGNFSDEEVRRRYLLNRFEPCPLSQWQLSEDSYEAARRAVCGDRSERYGTIREFWDGWRRAVDIS